MKLTILILSFLCFTAPVLAEPASDVPTQQKYYYQFIQNVEPADLPLVDGRIPEGSIGSKAEHFFGLVEKANLIVELDASLSIFNEAEKNKILVLNGIYNRTTDPYFADRNLLTKNIFLNLADNKLGKFQKVSVDKMVRFEIFQRSDSFSGGPTETHITAETSMSPLRAVLGPGSSRVVFWPWDWRDQSSGNFNVLSSVRVSEMVDASGVIRAIEVIARDASFESGPDLNAGWEPFVFEQKWGRWFPVTTVKGMKIENFCIRCHVTQDGRFSPYPQNVRDPETFKKIGYLNDKIIDKIMQYRTGE